MRTCFQTGVFLVVFVCIFSGCKKEYQDNIAVLDIMKKIENTVDFSEPELQNLKEDTMLAERYGISTEDISEGYCYTSVSPEQSADEIIIIKAGEEDKVLQLQRALEAEITGLSGTWESASQEEYDKVQSHVLKSKGNYIMLAVCADAKKAETVFDESFTS